MNIRAVVPNVTQEQAVCLFAPSGVSGRMHRIYRGRLLAVALVYVPFHVFWAEIRNGVHCQKRLFGVDAVNGSLDLYGFDDDVPPTHWLHTRNAIAPRLGESAARDALAHKLRRVVFGRGFFRVREFEMGLQPVLELYMPYWLGFRSGKNSLSLSVVDGMRRRVEGAKLRHLVRNWLSERV